jgi:hypothetical protein
MSSPLTPEQEAEAQQLAEAIRHAAADELLQIARTVVAAGDRRLFGQTEFEVRDRLLRIGARVYAAHLEKKKAATPGPASPAPTATSPPSSTATARERR